MTSHNHTRREFLKTIGMTASFVAMTGSLNILSCTNKQQRPPNIVIIFTDDQGYADVGCFGARGFTTPNLDQMASEGMKFTNFYVSQAVCSASRASLLTGCFSERVGIQGALMPWVSIGLNPDEETIADLLKKKGYATGMVGKWHLGHHEEFLPANQGFDEYLGLPYSNDMWPVGYDGKPATTGRKTLYPPLPLIDGKQKVAEIRTLDDQATLTTRYTERALRFIAKNKDRPFFLYMAHSMPHVPLGVSEKFKGKSEQGMYGDVIEEIDWSVGEILEALRQYDLEDNTLVIFASDNGPWLNFGNHAGSANPLNQGKGCMWEGGARVPCIMRWTGKIPTGKVCNNIAASIDVLPTIAAITNTPLPEKKIDGVNILPLLLGDFDANPRDHYFYYYGGELRAVRQGKWKLFFPHTYRSYKGVEPGRDGFPGPYARGEIGLALFDLENDIGETTDVAAQHPDVVNRLQELADKMRYQLGDRLTGINGNEVREPGRRFNEKIRTVQHLAVGKKIELHTEYSSRFKGGRLNALIDGRCGTTDYQDGTWQGYEGVDMDVTVDLGKATAVKKISCEFLSAQMSWIFLPRSVEISVSSDGKNFDVIKRFTEKLEVTGEATIKNYTANLPKRNARFIRVLAKNQGVCPPWHPGAGGKAWVFCDEIVVE